MALKELGLSLAQVRRLQDGVTLGDLRGMLLLRRAQLEHELDQHKNQLLGVEARLRSIAAEDGTPADDIVAKTIPATGVVVIAGQAPGFGAANIVPVITSWSRSSTSSGYMTGSRKPGRRSSFTNATMATMSPSCWPCR
jgi:hypothetical protein